MVLVPAHYPSYLADLVETFIKNNEHTKEQLETMIQEYDKIEKRINGIKIQGDAHNEWWDPNPQQLQAIHSVIFEILGPYYRRTYLTFYNTETHGPYIVSGKEYTAYLGLGFPNFTLQLKGGKKRNVLVFILPEHDGAKFPT